MADPSFDPDAILDTLVAHRVDFVIIGGIAAAIHGAGWTTFDLDIVVSTSDDNLARLTDALLDLDAVYETFDSRRIEPDLARVRSLKGPQLLKTRHGRLDVLKEAGGETFETLATDAVRASSTAASLSLASVAALLRMKQAANRAKDQPGNRAPEGVARKVGRRQVKWPAAQPGDIDDVEVGLHHPAGHLRVPCGLRRTWSRFDRPILLHGIPSQPSGQHASAVLE